MKEKLTREFVLRLRDKLEEEADGLHAEATRLRVLADQIENRARTLETVAEMVEERVP